MHVPIQLYLDETTLDNCNKLSLHPLVMTLMIYNRKTQRNYTHTTQQKPDWTTREAPLPAARYKYNGENRCPEQKQDQHGKHMASQKTHDNTPFRQRVKNNREINVFMTWLRVWGLIL